MTPPNSAVPSGTYPSGRKAVSTRPFPMSFYKTFSFPLKVVIVPFRQLVSTLFGVTNGFKSIIIPS